MLANHFRVVVLIALALTSCVSQSFPTHGGGKRFYWEQHIVSRSAREAVDQLELGEKLKGVDGVIRVNVIAMADDGGGFEASSESPLGFLGFGREIFPAVDSSNTAARVDSKYRPYQVSTARDMAYLTALVERSLAEANVTVATDLTSPTADPIVGELFVLVSEFGTAKTTSNWIVYSSRALRARTTVSAYLVKFEKKDERSASSQKRYTYLSIGSGRGTVAMKEGYIFGIGPIGDASERVMSESEDLSRL